MAVKVLRATDDEFDETRFVAELRVMATLRHPRVVLMLCACRDLSISEGNAAIVLELMERGSLYRILHGNGGSPQVAVTTDVDRFRCSVDIASGMQFLHSSRLIHRDLKSHNVLVDSEGRCKISDFGMATYRGVGASRVSVRAGTAAWSSPESFDNGELRESTVSSRGVTILMQAMLI